MKRALQHKGFFMSGQISANLLRWQFVDVVSASNKKRKRVVTMNRSLALICI